MMKPDEIIKRWGGNVADFARAINCSRATPHLWKDTVPAERVIAICKAFNWEITPHQIRPDLYPNPTDGVPSDA